MGQALCGLSSRQRHDAVVKSSGYRFFEAQKVPPKSLKACLDLFLEGAPDKDGTVRPTALQLQSRHCLLDTPLLPTSAQLSYDQFARLLQLNRKCTQTKRLCQAFDADSGGTIDFRECVAGAASLLVSYCAKTALCCLQVCLRPGQVPERLL